MRNCFQHSDRRTDDGNAAVVRNGHLPERDLQIGLGPATVKITKVRSKTGEPVTFWSALVPSLCAQDEVSGGSIAMLYLKGLSSGEMGEALKVLIGPEARRLFRDSPVTMLDAQNDERPQPLTQIRPSEGQRFIA